MFKSTGTASAEKIKQNALEEERNFIIAKNDKLLIKVYSNGGERLIDPNPELSQTGSIEKSTSQNEPNYLIDLQGLIKLPLVGEIKLDDLTLKQAEDILQKEYAKFFKEPFVQLTFVNKRVIVLGALGGQVIPLENENTSLAEVLALAKGLDKDSKAHNMRLIRADKVYEIDFSTIEGFKNGNMLVHSGDIVYVEPVRRPFSEGLRDYSGVISMIVALATLVTLVSSIK